MTLLQIVKSPLQSFFQAEHDFRPGRRRNPISSDDRSSCLRMSVESGLLTMQRASSERGEGKAKLAVDYAGEPMTIGITRTFFLDAVRVVETEDVAIKFSDPGSPIMVESNGYRSVIAPCQLK